MRIIKSLLKGIFIAGLVFVCIPLTVVIIVFTSMFVELSGPAKEHSLSAYEKDLNIELPIKAKLDEIYSINNDGEYNVYVVYDLKKEVNIESLVNYGFTIESTYDESILEIISKIDKNQVIESDDRINISSNQYILYVSPKENFDYYFIYDTRIDKFIIAYSWN